MFNSPRPNEIVNKKDLIKKAITQHVIFRVKSSEPLTASSYPISKDKIKIGFNIKT